MLKTVFAAFFCYMNHDLLDFSRYQQTYNQNLDSTAELERKQIKEG